MKKTLPLTALLLSAGLALAPLGAQRSAQDSGLDSRVAALEDALAKEQKAHAETRALLEETVTYLQEQAKSAQGMLEVLDAAEAAGFTAGINFRSREILLAGWREAYGTAQTDVPEAKKPAPAPAR
jgi:hypothetical protein